jgi:hypothetical protein
MLSTGDVLHLLALVTRQFRGRLDLVVDSVRRSLVLFVQFLLGNLICGLRFPRRVCSCLLRLDGGIIGTSICLILQGLRGLVRLGRGIIARALDVFRAFCGLR